MQKQRKMNKNSIQNYFSPETVQKRHETDAKFNITEHIILKNHTSIFTYFEKD